MPKQHAIMQFEHRVEAQLHAYFTVSMPNVQIKAVQEQQNVRNEDHHIIPTCGPGSSVGITNG